MCDIWGEFSFPYCIRNFYGPKSTYRFDFGCVKGHHNDAGSTSRLNCITFSHDSYRVGATRMKTLSRCCRVILCYWHYRIPLKCVTQLPNISMEWTELKGRGERDGRGEKRGAKQEEVLKGGKEGLEERIEREVERTWRWCVTCDSLVKPFWYDGQ